MTSIGKQRGLSRLADENGHFTMVALDQRPPMAQAIAKSRNLRPEDVSFDDMIRSEAVLATLKEDGLGVLRRMAEVTRGEAKSWAPDYALGTLEREGAFSCAYA